MTDRQSIREVDELARKVHWSIWIIATAIGLFFGWLQLRNLPIGTIVEQATPQWVIRFLLAIYYPLWFVGAPTDLHLQRSVYISDPERGKLSLTAILLLCVFGIIAFGLVWASDDEMNFVVTWSVFTATMVIGFSYILSRINSMVQPSRAKYAGDLFGLEAMDRVTHYMTAWWQWVRFGFLIALALAADVFVFVPEFRRFVAEYLALIPVGVSADAWAKLLPATMFGLFVIAGEAWIWAMRLRTWMAVDVIDDLARRYDGLLPRKTVTRFPL